MPLSPSSSAQSAREALATRLRELRADAGLTGHGLALVLGWSESKVSRIANAKTPPSDADIRAWCEACGAGDKAADLVAANRQADEMYIEWKRLHRTGMKHAQETVLPLVERSRQIRVYCSNVVPGMLQRREYARALMTTITEFQQTPDDVDAAVESRLQRSRYLHEGSRTFALVVEETVLRYPIGDKVAMEDQLRYLLEIMGAARVSLGVIPFGAPRLMWPLEAFSVFDDRQVNAELLSAAVTITTPGEIAVYMRAFRILASMAVYGRAAKSCIEDALTALG
ncbi:helix-turn-helix protein [Streptomyces sp. 1114.5]|uniref:helix-turn-helix domain-containing protein n=1 Tax=unclassified Streptomyces TaxID=2593676 RepID=UPI000BC8EC53|nr:MULTISPECIES: helix-turn-helix transcriptional regulator [unclassified Streptomyces]RKT18528.1 helix-turn-helix protein [Streptomyces sp. 1114.5]SOB84729.1 Helix-turn-helix domain-containing protein [Streptomyces sp. 1331.2]